MLQRDFFVLLGLIGMERRRKSAKHLQNINGCGLGRRFRLVVKVRKWPIFTVANPNNHSGTGGHRTANNCSKQVLHAFLIFDFANRQKSTHSGHS